MVAFRGNNNATGTKYRLSKKGGNLIGADFKNLIFQLFKLGGKKRSFANITLCTVIVGAGNMVDRILNIIELRGVIAGLTTNRHGRIGRTVIGVNPRNNMFLCVLAATVLVKMNKAVSRINRRRTPTGQGHMVEITGC